MNLAPDLCGAFFMLQVHATNDILGSNGHRVYRNSIRSDLSVNDTA